MKKAPILLLAALLLSACSPLPAVNPSGTAAASLPPAATVLATEPTPTAASSATPSPSPSAKPTATPSPSPTPTAQPTATPQPTPTGKPAAVSLQLPPVLYGVAGREMSLYLDNVVLTSGTYECSISGVGKLEGRRWSWTPDKEGEYRLTVRTGNQKQSTAIRVVKAEAGEGATRKCLFIGDSITEKGSYTGRLLELAKADGLKLTLLGSRGVAPNLTEGRAGWRALHYTGYRSVKSVPNSFFNVKTKRFDFKNYMKSMKYASMDRVCIGLGTNDVFGFQNDTALKAEINRVLKRMDTMVKSIRSYDKKIRIGILITIPPTNQPKTFLDDYGTAQTLARYSRNRYLFANALIAKYKGQEKNGVYLVPVNANFDTQYCHGVHPFDEGYNQMAEAIWCWLKNLEQ